MCCFLFFIFNNRNSTQFTWSMGEVKIDDWTKIFFSGMHIKAISSQSYIYTTGNKCVHLWARQKFVNIVIEFVMLGLYSGWRNSPNFPFNSEVVILKH